MKDLKAHVDLATGKIYGCKKGSWKWHHEKGHLVFNSSPKTSIWLLVQQYSFDLWMISITLSLAIRPLIPFAGIFWGIYIGITIYEEWWCNQYAYKKTGGKK